ncbi:MAG TPA: RNA polymerase sigma factor [Solirubrobacteraceae bacterium]|nr:RNA polymerase sigma factor [Solirubrobacteraceae bacterium]
MSTTRPDTVLVAALRGGDAGAFDQIHQRYAGELIGYARQVLGGAHHDAEEVVQDAFMRALASLRATERPMALRPWLYAIVRNRALDELRRPHRRRIEDELELLPLADSGPASDPHEALLRREALAGVVSAINELPPRQRLALVLRELDDRSHDEVAATLGVSRGASKTLVHRAKATLALAA